MGLNCEKKAAQVSKSVLFESNTTRAARAAQGCTKDSVRVDTGSQTREWRSDEERTYRDNDSIYPEYALSEENPMDCIMHYLLGDNIIS